MIIKNISIKNLKSFGNDPQEINLTNEGNLILLSGKNGAGKCVSKTTLIDIKINDLDINDKLISYLEETELGNEIFLYIRKNNSSLYDKIKDYQQEKIK